MSVVWTHIFLSWPISSQTEHISPHNKPSPDHPVSHSRLFSMVNTSMMVSVITIRQSVYVKGRGQTWWWVSFGFPLTSVVFLFHLLVWHHLFIQKFQYNSSTSCTHVLAIHSCSYHTAVYMSYIHVLTIYTWSCHTYIHTLVMHKVNISKILQLQYKHMFLIENIQNCVQHIRSQRQIIERNTHKIDQLINIYVPLQTRTAPTELPTIFINKYFNEVC